ncbi:YciI family protein [Undibacterium sp. SXout11W]|uniref:YciI family protein n=1 Tax=Undibacterium sp. SXout11W TaxID=3413050 RepID=UPI003BF30B65
MLFAVLFTDQPGKANVRLENLSAHIEWLEINKRIIPIGGSLREELGQVPKGGLWIAEADSKNQIEELLKTDPFYIAGLRQSYDILHWSKANEDRKVML